MKKIIQNKIYDTETATEVASWDNGYFGNDFNCCAEALFVTSKGAYFLYGEGGPLSKYAKSYGNSWSGSEDIELLTEAEAYKVLEENQQLEAIAKKFPDMTEEG